MRSSNSTLLPSHASWLYLTRPDTRRAPWRMETVDRNWVIRVRDKWFLSTSNYRIICHINEMRWQTVTRPESGVDWSAVALGCVTKSTRDVTVTSYVVGVTVTVVLVAVSESQTTSQFTAHHRGTDTYDITHSSTVISSLFVKFWSRPRPQTFNTRSALALTILIIININRTFCPMVTIETGLRKACEWWKTETPHSLS